MTSKARGGEVYLKKRMASRVGSSFLLPSNRSVCRVFRPVVRRCCHLRFSPMHSPVSSKFTSLPLLFSRPLLFPLSGPVQLSPVISDQLIMHHDQESIRFHHDSIPPSNQVSHIPFLPISPSSIQHAHMLLSTSPLSLLP